MSQQSSALAAQPPAAPASQVGAVLGGEHETTAVEPMRPWPSPSQSGYHDPVTVPPQHTPSTQLSDVHCEFVEHA